MDMAVGLVESYLRVNGYFTVTEYPVVELLGSAEYRTATDVDILAFRLPGVRPDQVASAAAADGPDNGAFAPDAALDCPRTQADMIIGEVKEGRAELNRGATRTEVLQAVLARFGCCSADDLDVAEGLRINGRVLTHAGHQARLVAFGTEAVPHRGYHTVSLGHVLEYLEGYLATRWPVLRHAHFKDPTLAMLALAHKIRNSSRQDSFS